MSNIVRYPFPVLLFVLCTLSIFLCTPLATRSSFILSLRTPLPAMVRAAISLSAPGMSSRTCCGIQHLICFVLFFSILSFRTCCGIYHLFKYWIPDQVGNDNVESPPFISPFVPCTLYLVLFPPPFFLRFPLYVIHFPLYLVHCTLYCFATRSSLSFVLSTFSLHWLHWLYWRYWLICTCCVIQMFIHILVK